MSNSAAAMQKKSSTFTRYVQVGRTVLLPSLGGKVGVIVQIVDHNRALVDSPSFDRQVIQLKHLILLPSVIELPLAAGKAAVRKQFTKHDVLAKFEQSTWGKKLAARKLKENLNDFEKFQVMCLKKQKRDIVRKSMHKAKKSASA